MNTFPNNSTKIKVCAILFYIKVGRLLNGNNTLTSELKTKYTKVQYIFINVATYFIKVEFSNNSTDR